MAPQRGGSTERARRRPFLCERVEDGGCVTARFCEGSGVCLLSLSGFAHCSWRQTVKEFMVFCVSGPSGVGAGVWKSTFPCEYLKGG